MDRIVKILLVCLIIELLVCGAVFAIAPIYLAERSENLIYQDLSFLDFLIKWGKIQLWIMFN